MLEEFTDIQLLRALKTSNRDKVFRILYNRYYPDILKRCIYLIKDKQECENLAHDILMKIEKKQETYKEQSAFKTWLFAVCYKECLQYLRKRKRLDERKLDLGLLNDLYGHIELEITEDKTFDKLMAKLDILDALDKALVLMKYQDGMKIAQIALQLEMGESRIKMRLKRAKAKLLNVRM